MPTITCPSRFHQDDLLIKWLAEIVGLEQTEIATATEVPFMRNPRTNEPAGQIDLIIADNQTGNDIWYALEIQAVYFSGEGMKTQFEIIRDYDDPTPPFPNVQRRPDWRSSSAKRLAPQLQIKVPTLRGYLGKTAVAIDLPFFNELGGPTEPDKIKTDPRDGDVIWLIPKLELTDDQYRLVREHYEVLTLDESVNKLLNAVPESAQSVLAAIQSKLRPFVVEG